MSKKNKNNLKSNCCNAKIKIVGKITMYYVCLKCKKPCDVHVNKRKVWIRNPKTQIVPNKNKQKSTKLTSNELKEIHKNEDF